MRSPQFYVSGKRPITGDVVIQYIPPKLIRSSKIPKYQLSMSFLWLPIAWQFYTEHSGDWTTETDVTDERDVLRFEFQMGVGGREVLYCNSPRLFGSCLETLPIQQNNHSRYAYGLNEEPTERTKVNSLGLGVCGSNYKSVIFKYNSCIKFTKTSCERAIIWIWGGKKL